MSKLLTVARREYLYNLRRPSFLFAVFGVPLFTFVIWAVIFAVSAASDDNIDQIGRVGYVDQAGVLEDAVYLPDQPDLFLPFAEDAAARAALDAGEIGAYLTLPPDYMKTGSLTIYSYNGIPGALRDKIDTFLLANLSRELSAAVPVARVQEPVELTIRAADTGREMDDSGVIALFFIPLIFAFVLLMASNTTSGFLMGGIVEEKTSRIMEILVTSITPMQMLMGKILGLGMLGLTQLLVWGAAGFLLIRFGQSIPALAGISFPLDLMVLAIIYFLLSYFLLASMMAGLGAFAASEEESRQYAGIFSIIWVIPFFFITQLISEPNGNVAVALTLIPFTAPMTALLRLGFAVIPAWQIAASLAILFLTALIVVWASARVFRYSLLLYGKRATPREIWRVVRGAPAIATTVAHSEEATA